MSAWEAVVMKGNACYNLRHTEILFCQMNIEKLINSGWQQKIYLVACVIHGIIITRKTEIL